MEVFRLISYSVSHIFIMCYILIFVKWKYSPGKTVGVAIITGLMLIGLEVVRYMGLSQGIRQIWPIVLQITIVQVSTLYLSVHRDFRGLFTGLTSSNYVLFGNLISRVVHSAGGGIWQSTAVGIVIHLLFLLLLVHHLRPSYMEVQRLNRKEWFGLCLIPSAFYLSLLFLMYCLKGDSLIQNFAMLSVLLTLYLSYILMFRMIENIYAEEAMEKERNILDMNIKTVKRIMEEIHLVERQIAIQNHDRRHLARTMKVLLAAEDYKSVIDLLGEVEHVSEYVVGSHYCDNTSVNGVVCYYADIAHRSKVQVHIGLDIPEKILVSEWELAVVLGNLMENAVQAASEIPVVSERVVWVTVKPVRDQLLIELLNSYKGRVLFDQKTGLPQSNKGEGHGVGLGSVLYFCEKNQGAFDCGIAEDLFFVRLLV